jgi:hypothetical protein
VLPQPSPAGPQLYPSDAHVSGVHVGAPHTPGVPPPPHVWPAGQLPQLRSPPQPSGAGPHWTPACAQVSGVHVGGGGGAAPLHTGDARSKNMNSSARSCADIAVVVQPPGKGLPVASPEATWMSLKTTRPQVVVEPTGPLNEMY